LVVTIAIIAGTGAVAGEEAEGTLELLLAQPLSRRRLLLSKALAALAAIPAFAVGLVVVDIDIGFGRLVAATVMLLPLAALFLALAPWASAAFPTRSAATVVVVVVGVLVASYVLQVFGLNVDFLAGPRHISPFYWADASETLRNGFPWARFIGLSVLAGALVAGAIWSFDRRDIANQSRDWSVGDLVRFRRRTLALGSAPPGGTD